jgi:hypothetical protein
MTRSKKIREGQAPPPRSRPRREVLGIADFTDADIEAVRRTDPSREADAFNHEV